MTKHIHADSMVKYAEDAAETETPWKRWQYKTSVDENWNPCLYHPIWKETNSYRPTPKTVTINGHEFPDMYTGARELDLNNATEVWVVNAHYHSYPVPLTPRSISDIKQSNGIIGLHRTKESANAHRDLIKPVLT